MNCKCIVVIFWVFVYVYGQNEKLSFRILAPEFICPKDQDAVIEKADETVILLQTAAGSDLLVDWKVRWEPLPSPTQRLTLLVWKAVRELEALLTLPQKQKYVYVIDNSKLLQGIVYIFTVNVRTPEGMAADPKSFQIDNSQGKKELSDIEGRAARFSVTLLGSQIAYPDSEFVLEAQVTTCSPTEDYHFSWTLHSLDLEYEVDTSNVASARLVVPANSLMPGLTYDANCQVIRTSTNEFITQTGLPFEVSSRGITVYLGSDTLVLAKEAPFYIETLIHNRDYFNKTPTFEWSCVYNEKSCGFFESCDTADLNLPSGLDEVGIYKFGVTVRVGKEISSAEITVTVLDASLLPTLQISPRNRLLNEGSTALLTASATNVAPSCEFTWYFQEAGVEYAPDSEGNGSCVKCQHGTVLSDTVTVNSLEENFLEELADFTNSTQRVNLEVRMPAASGRIRLVADCGCSLTFNCESQGAVYADVNVVMNQYPKAGGVLVSPESGVALETVFRISTEAVTHQEVPLKYTFLCAVSVNQSLVLAFYVDHNAVETILPYVDDSGTKVWVEVCDALGACSMGAVTHVPVARSSGRTVAQQREASRGNARRCEMTLLQRLAVSALVTFSNSELPEALATFSLSLHELLESPEMENCKNIQPEQYDELINSLLDVGFDFSKS